MTLRDEQRAVGREGLVRTFGIDISVIIRDVQVRTQAVAVAYLIEPTAGKGKAWIDANEVRIVGWSE